jgi:hypothetical protein
MYRLRSANAMFQSLEAMDLELGTEVKFSGFEMGKLTVFRKYVDDGGVRVIIKEAGQTAWSGRGETSYYHPRLYVGYVVRDRFWCVYESEYTKSTRKQIIEEAIRRMNAITVTPDMLEDELTEIEDFAVYLPETPLSRVYGKLKAIDTNLEFMHNMYVKGREEQ